MRDPRVEPRKGDVLLMGDGETYAVIQAPMDEWTVWCEVSLMDRGDTNSHMRRIGTPYVEFATATIIHVADRDEA